MTLLQAVPTIVTDASAGITVGEGQLLDVATVSGLVSPTGAQAVTFNLYGPADAACAGPAVFTEIAPLTLDASLTGGTAQSSAFTPTSPGTYGWVATYNGDVNNAPVSGTCGDTTETRTALLPTTTQTPTTTSTPTTTQSPTTTQPPVTQPPAAQQPPAAELPPTGSPIDRAIDVGLIIAIAGSVVVALTRRKAA